MGDVGITGEETCRFPMRFRHAVEPVQGRADGLPDQRLQAGEPLPFGIAETEEMQTVVQVGGLAIKGGHVYDL